MNELRPGTALVEVVSGPAGHCLCIGDESTGHRLSGPKPWGGGRTIHSFVVNIDELIKEAEALRYQGEEIEA